MKTRSIKNKSKKLNTIGLMIGIIGVILLFSWGPPQPKFELGIGIQVEDETVINGITAREHDLIIEKRKERFEKMSRRGLGFIIIGFSIQLVAIWIPEDKDEILIDNKSL